MNNNVDIKQKMKNKLGKAKGNKLYNYTYKQLKKDPKVAGRYIPDDKSDRILIFEEYSKNNLIPVVWYNLEPSAFDNPSFSVVDFDLLDKDELLSKII